MHDCNNTAHAVYLSIRRRLHNADQAQCKVYIHERTGLWQDCKWWQRQWSSPLLAGRQLARFPVCFHSTDKRKQDFQLCCNWSGSDSSEWRCFPQLCCHDCRPSNRLAGTWSKHPHQSLPCMAPLLSAGLWRIWPPGEIWLSFSASLQL